MRAFIALELPADFADDTAAAARRLSASLEGRFLDRSTYHLTLAFLGDIDDAEASRAMDALDVACAGSCAFRKSPYRHWPSRCRRTPAPSHCSRARFPATAPNTSRSTQWSWGSRQRCRRQPLIS